MLFYMDPYADQDTYPRIFQYQDDEGVATTRLMFDRSENDFILCQERRASSRTVSSGMRLSPEMATALFPLHAEKIAEFVK